jgi:uncharacterized protein
VLRCGGPQPSFQSPWLANTGSMAGEKNLQALLSSMSPTALEGYFVFVSVPEAPPNADVLATVREPEGLSVVLPQAHADRLGLTYDFVAGWITLRVHSALDAVGLTAAVSAALAHAGISCNVIAGYHHDHLLVPADRLADSMAILRSLSN